MSFRFVIDVRHIRDFGIGTYIRNLVHALSRQDQNNRYELIAYSADIYDLRELPSNFHATAYHRADSKLVDQLTFPMFLKRFNADLYHIPLNIVPVWMPRPYVVTIHDMSRLLYEQSTGLRNSLRLFRSRRGLMRADRVITVSAATRRDVEKILGVPADRIRQIYNAPDPKFLAHGTESERQEERRRILERYQINYPFLLYAGNIRPQKNIPRLVEAFAVVRGELENHSKYKDLRLVIIGDEISRYPSVRRAVIQTRVEPAVRFLGFVPQDTLRVFYEAASAFTFPSLYEGFGLPPLEAMASGTPVVTSNVSSLPEVVGSAAMIVNPENVFDIARGIREVLLDDNTRQRLIQKGFEQASHFSWDRTAAQVLETYVEVAGAARTHR